MRLSRATEKLGQSVAQAGQAPYPPTRRENAIAMSECVDGPNVPSSD